MGGLLTIADPLHRVQKNDFWLTVGYYRLKGEQEELEDEISISLEVGPQKTSFIGLFDGTDGSECSSYMAEHTLREVVRSPQFSADVEKALFQSILITDQSFLDVVQLRGGEEDEYCSSSGFVVVVRENVVYVASTGDSIGCAYSTNSGCTFLVDPEKTRPHILGSFYKKDRDIQLTADPITTNLPITPDLQFIFVGTSTLFDQITKEEAIDYIREQLDPQRLHSIQTAFDKHLSNICLDLITKANSKNPNVNISCFLLTFEHTNPFPSV